MASNPHQRALGHCFDCPECTKKIWLRVLSVNGRKHAAAMTDEQKRRRRERGGSFRKPVVQTVLREPGDLERLRQAAAGRGLSIKQLTERLSSFED